MGSGTFSHLSLKIIAAAVALAIAPLAAQRPAAPPRPVPPKRTAPAPARAEAVVPFRVGEQLSYDISWSSFITATAATATVSVREKRWAYGSLAYYLVAEGRPTSIVAMFYSVYYKADSWLNAYDLLPLRASVFSQERDRRQNKITLFDQSRGRAEFEVEGTKSRQTLRVPPRTQDPLSAVFALRSLPLARGTRTQMPITFNGAVYQVEVTVNGQEPVQTPTGRRTAWRLTPVVQEKGSSVASPRGMTMWLSADARRLPLKMQVELPMGQFVLTLTSAR